MSFQRRTCNRHMHVHVHKPQVISEWLGWRWGVNAPRYLVRNESPELTETLGHRLLVGKIPGFKA